MIIIDGSYGEGGGQILRTSLSLAAITGQSLRLENIRAGRKKPGLAAQHLTVVRAMTRICQAQCQGDKIGSQMLEFMPNCSPQAGYYTFDVRDATEGGSAGAITLILQAILLPLALAQGDSVVILRGGTHVPFSPPITYIEQVYLPFLKQLGIEVDLKLNGWGWYPRGGGEAEIRINGGNKINNLELLSRGNFKQIKGLAIVTELPSHIPQRMASRTENLLKKANLRTQIKPLREQGVASGAGLFLTAEYDNIKAGFSALGRQGLPAETVAEMAVKELLKFHRQDAPVEHFLGDQLLLPLALASGISQYQVAEITSHLSTNAWTILQFGVAEVQINKEQKIITIKPHN
jgi:RNA 3'-terminal phosphate cyclase (ATP)